MAAHSCDPAASAGITKFGLSLFALLAENPSTDVVLLSPISVASALGLAAAGATLGGSAERELLTAVGIADHAKVAELSAAIMSGDAAETGVQLRIANSVWVKQGVLPSYVELVEQAHGARAAQLGATYDELNAWVASKTEGRIAKLMDPPTVDPLVRAVLVNAVYFLGSWASAFDPRATVDRPFHAPGGPVPARFMCKVVDGLAAAPALASLGGATAVRLDYGKGAAGNGGDGGGPMKPSITASAGAEFCALLVLPAEPGAESMAAAVAGLQGTSLRNLLATLPQQKVKLQLPRFKASWGAEDLVAALRSLGLARAFDGSGEFLRLSNDAEVHIAQVFHKATIEVTEEGTVATAATAVVMKTRSLPRPPPEIIFDRPFLMLVVHVPTGVPLFIGRFNKPQLEL